MLTLITQAGKVTGFTPAWLGKPIPVSALSFLCDPVFRCEMTRFEYIAATKPHYVFPSVIAVENIAATAPLEYALSRLARKILKIKGENGSFLAKS